MDKAALRRRATAAVAATLLASIAAPGTGVAAPPGPRTVSYHGYQLTVPASWRLVDLTTNPKTCLRLDLPSVYLGHPGDQSGCPAHLVGRTAGILIEPLDQSTVGRINDDVRTTAAGSATAPEVTPSRDGTIQVAVEAAGVLVTAQHAPDTELVVREMLAGARLTAGATPTALPARSPNSIGVTAVSPQPGTYLGKGFDACTAPSQSAMNSWAASPYRAVGIYISGPTRACGQPNLTASWVSTQVANGWHLIPIDVGFQASCSGFSNKMSSNPTTARSQGGDEARTSVAAAQALGLPAGSAIYSDIENYPSNATCKAAYLSYLSGWTETLHGLGYLAGVYSSVSSGITDAASGFTDPTYTPVDHIWFAWWNDRADTDTGSFAPATLWANHQRLHQYHGGVTETWGGTSINIDRNFLDVVDGTPTPPSICITANLDFTSYPSLSSGASGSAVTAAQCLLRAAGHEAGTGDPTGVFDAATVSATQAFQQSIGLPVTGTVDAHTWTALLSSGSTPTLLSGSTGTAVKRLQRALTAALNRTVAIDGLFGPGTNQAVRDYQSAHGLTVDGIVGPATWGALQAGR